MDRDSKLLVGALLIFVGLTAYYFGHIDEELVVEFADKVFMVSTSAGLLLYLNGLLQSREIKGDGRLYVGFFPLFLASGAGVSFVGFLVAFLLANYSPVIPVVIFLGALAAIPGGLFIAAMTWSVGCRACRTPLDTTSCDLDVHATEVIESAMKSAGVGTSGAPADAQSSVAVPSLIALDGATVLQAIDRTRAAMPRERLALQYCKKCREVGLISTRHHHDFFVAGRLVGELADKIANKKASA